MRYGPTKDGGRSVQGDTPFGKFFVIWDKDNSLVKAENTPKDPLQTKKAEPNNDNGTDSGSGPGNRTTKELSSGITGMIKNELGIGQADEPTIDSRYNICTNCPSGKNKRGVCTAKGCGCYIAAKIKLKSEKCPLGHW